MSLMILATVPLALVGRVVFSFADPAIDESSGLVDLGATMVTTNDSGGDPLVFVVDPRTGQTIARTTFADQVQDVEALAPAGAHAVWVGDIGDNAAQRDSVRVYRVPVGSHDERVDAPSYDLVYPDGAHDAESLVAGPGGRLYLITKGLLRGTVYAAPRHLDPNAPNRLSAVGSVDMLATDAALFPDGRHVLVRGYGTAAVYTFPGFRPVARFALPRQKQGEGVSIGASGRIRISSEGVHSPVLQVALPADVRGVVDGTAAAIPSRSASPTPRPSHSVDAGTTKDGPLPKGLVMGGTLGVLVAITVWVATRRRRR